MYRSKLHSLCNRIAISSVNRKIQTNSALLVTKRRVPKVYDDPGIRNQKALYNDDADFLKKLEDNEEDLEDQEVDFMNVNAAYDEHFREKKRKKRFVENMIIKKKFFSPRTQPLMLTCSEKEMIKHLNKSDPVQWDIRTLSENFPATPDVIIKVLKTKWKRSPERQRILDMKVEENWKLLEKGELDADPHVIEHLKKFVNCRQSLLEKVKNADFYLPEIKDEPVYNNGEMNKIISYYERLINELDKKWEADKLLTDGLSKEKNLEIYDAQKQKSSLSILHEKIDEERKFRNIEGEESFIMSKMSKTQKKHITFEHLQHEVLNKADANKKLGLVEKAILEFTSGINSHSESEPAICNAQTDESVKTEEKKESTLNRIENQELPAEMLEKETTLNRIENQGLPAEMLEKETTWNRIENQELPAEMLEKETTLNRIENQELPAEMLEKETTWNRIENQGFPAEMLEKETTERIINNGANECNVDWNKKEKSSRKNEIEKNKKNEKKSKGKSSMSEYQIFPPADKNTFSANETDVGQVLNRLKEAEKVMAIKDEIGNEEEKSIEVDPERKRREELYYEKEAKDIQNTPFWNNSRGSAEKALAEFEKAPLGGPEDSRNLAGVLSHDCYPERIEIPKGKRGKGLTFKVNDCYYDDDGEFLYRVPGMTK